MQLPKAPWIIMNERNVRPCMCVFCARASACACTCQLCMPIVTFFVPSVVASFHSNISLRAQTWERGERSWDNYCGGGCWKRKSPWWWVWNSVNRGMRQNEKQMHVLCECVCVCLISGIRRYHAQMNWGYGRHDYIHESVMWALEVKGLSMF